MDSDEGTLSVPVDDWDQLLEERHRPDDGALEDRLTAELAELGAKARRGVAVAPRAPRLRRSESKRVLDAAGI